MSNISDIAALIKPELNIIDASTILTRGGPFYEDGTPTEFNKLIISGEKMFIPAVVQYSPHR